MSVPTAPLNAPPKGYGPAWHQMLQRTGWWHSFELPDGKVIEGVNSIDSLKDRIAQFPIPQDLTGRRVLDIGAWDGWFSFEMERRGAEVVAIDCFDNPRFREMHAIYGSRVDYRQMDVYEVTPQSVGHFDIVLFLGVLYHLKHPLLALERICAVTRELAAVDSFVLRDNFDPDARAVLEFYETTEMEGQIDNWVAPNVACLMAMCRTAGFARVNLQKILPYSACVACFRQWEPGDPDGPRCDLQGAVHNTNAGINFDTRRDDYVLCFFRAGEEARGIQPLTIQDVQPQVSGYGVRPIHVTHISGDVWQSDFKLPPGLSPGWHQVSVALRGGPPSNSFPIAVDVPLAECEPRIEGLRDSLTWGDRVLDLRSGRGICLWCSSLPDNADRNNVHVFLNGARCTIDFVAPGTGVRQVNARVPETIESGAAQVVVKVGSSVSEPVTLNLRHA